jgi:hypothetical protein
MPKLPKKIKKIPMAKVKEKKDKVGIVLKEFQSGKLPIGKSKKKVTNRKQAIAIALSESGQSKKKLKKKKK